MAARKHKVELRGAPAPVAAAAARVVEADATHSDIPSPAAQMQARIDAAFRAGPAEYPEPVVGLWPGAVRVAILGGGAIASWTAVWQIARLL